MLVLDVVLVVVAAFLPSILGVGNSSVIIRMFGKIAHS
jgi:hypothetical protein